MDKATYTKLVLEAESTLYHVARSILTDNYDCADAVQEAILKSYSKLYTLKEEAYFKTWLVRILINECYKIRKQQKKVILMEEYEKKQYAGERNSYSELYEALMEMEERIRVPVVLYYLDGFKIHEISKILKIPEGTIKSRLSRGRHVLREKLEA